ncbi:thiamine-phosphate kinase [Sphingomonas naphthae]|uniref:Thiamine-monophosphate kinase n=1 Tax=Sphingomonas naphthae TaxID=1813468 RepID=A0ABY7TMD7_9SPHN|nr:thiamine-phosphate kinase [Sphingomonas naphthae]WCT73857.1 thiamine-phosphate kinase [Sphingomonas naphthae]
MSRESAFIDRLREIATHPAARGLRDDAAVLGGLVLTHDMIVEGVHFLPHDPPEDVAWKLVATNLSDLAAKGARPVGALLGCGLGGADEDWDYMFLSGLKTACERFALPLLGGDTVSMPRGAPRTFGLTALGAGSPDAPARDGAGPDDILWVTGTIGDAGLGLAIAQGEDGPRALIDRYRRPEPRLEAGRAIAPLAHAMMDVSDGLLIDASRMAEASGVGLNMDLDAVPLSALAIGHAGEDRAARLRAATAGDDYELLFATPATAAEDILRLRQDLGLRITLVGRFRLWPGLSVHDVEGMVPLPRRLGYEHDRR